MHSCAVAAVDFGGRHMPRHVVCVLMKEIYVMNLPGMCCILISTSAHAKDSGKTRTQNECMCLFNVCCLREFAFCHVFFAVNLCLCVHVGLSVCLRFQYCISPNMCVHSWPTTAACFIQNGLNAAKEGKLRQMKRSAYLSTFPQNPCLFPTLSWQEMLQSLNIEAREYNEKHISVESFAYFCVDGN